MLCGCVGVPHAHMYTHTYDIIGIPQEISSFVIEMMLFTMNTHVSVHVHVHMWGVTLTYPSTHLQPFEIAAKMKKKVQNLI